MAKIFNYLKTNVLTYFFVACFFVTFLVSMHSQNLDNQLRIGYALGSNVTDKLDWSIKVQQRFDHNFAQFDRVLFEPGLSYQLFKNIKVSTDFRYILFQDKYNNWNTKYRLSGDISYRLKVNRTRINFSSKLQYGLSEFSDFVNVEDNKLVNRYGAELKYNIYGSKFTPFIGSELFYNLGGINKILYTGNESKLGTEYAFNKRNSLSLFYCFQYETNVVNPKYANIYTIGYSMEF